MMSNASTAAAESLAAGIEAAAQAMLELHRSCTPVGTALPTTRAGLRLDSIAYQVLAAETGIAHRALKRSHTSVVLAFEHRIVALHAERNAMGGC